MALPVFSPPVAPQVGSSGGVQFRTRVLQFGDGYSQHTGDGINAVLKPVTLVWSSIDPTDADTIVAFMEARGGIEAFDYTPPLESAARAFRCRQVDRSHATAARDSLTLTLEPAFDVA